MRKQRVGNVTKTRRLSFSKSESKTPQKELGVEPEVDNSTASSISDIEEHETDLSDILKRNWKIYQTSPLYNFDENKFNIYGKKLRDGLAAAHFRKEMTFESTFLSCPYLKRPGDKTNCFVVEVIMHTKVVYTGYFMSWSPSTNSPEHFTSVPILLVQSPAHIAVEIHKVICKLFDCDVTPVTLSVFNLISQFSFCLNFLSNSKPDESAAVSLQYHIPGCPENDSIILMLALVDVLTVLSLLVHKNDLDGKITGSELVHEFYQRILNQIQIVYELDMSMAELFKVTLPQISITSDGRVTWNKSEIAYESLKLLQELTQVNPDVFT